MQYKQQIKAIERLPTYLFVHAQRHGYCQAKQESERVDLKQNKKSYHRVRINKILDLFELCESNLKEKLQLGRYERHQMFYPYDMNEQYAEFKSRLKSNIFYHLDVGDLSDDQIRYLYFDNHLYQLNIFHEFFFETLKNSKATGEYRLVGVILHKGDYYHHPDQSHNHDCKGEFQCFVYKRHRQWVRYRKAEVEYVDVDEVTDQRYWGREGDWTPVLYMYKQIRMKNVQLQPQKQGKKKKNTKEQKQKKEEQMKESQRLFV